MTFDKIIKSLLKGERICNVTWDDTTSTRYVQIREQELLDSDGQLYVISKKDLQNAGWVLFKE